MALLGSVGLLFVVFAPSIISLFSRDPVVHEFGVACLRIVSAGFVFYAFGMVVTQSFNGAGDTWTPTMINLFVFWFLEIPLGICSRGTPGWAPGAFSRRWPSLIRAWLLSAHSSSGAVPGSTRRSKPGAFPLTHCSPADRP